MDEYYTEREYGFRPQTSELIDERCWGGLLSLIRTRLGDASFGFRFPQQCPDSPISCDADEGAFRMTLEAEIPWIEWPLRADTVPDAPVVLDLLEFCATAIGNPEQGGWHEFFRHYHLTWDRAAGLARFVADANLIFRRNGVAFELDPKGKARRILPDSLNEALQWARFATGDAEADRLLEAARARIFDPKVDGRRDGLEKLWDAFERIKTLEPSADKKASISALLDRVAGTDSRMRAELETEAKALTRIGNTFRIRHSEVTQERIAQVETIDWLFGRMYSFVFLLLRATGRAS
jgi:hypothetical protein